MTEYARQYRDLPDDVLENMIRDASAERERRKVKPCVRRMDSRSENELFLDGCVIASVWGDTAAKMNIDHATAKRQISLAFCMADWMARANYMSLSSIKLGTKIHDEFEWLVQDIRGRDKTSTQDHAARAAGWIK